MELASFVHILLTLAVNGAHMDRLKWMRFLHNFFLVLDYELLPFNSYAEWDVPILQVHQEYFSDFNDSIIALLSSHVRQSELISILSFSMGRKGLICLF